MEDACNNTQSAFVLSRQALLYKAHCRNFLDIDFPQNAQCYHLCWLTVETQIRTPIQVPSCAKVMAVFFSKGNYSTKTHLTEESCKDNEADLFSKSNIF